jgi:peptide deformylase
MAVLEIKKYPSRILKQKALPVAAIDRELQILIDDMIETMYAAPGVGLAAPQVGVSKRLAVIDVSTKDEQMPVLVLINPECIERDGAVDREGRHLEIEAGGLLAIALQHEIDHLDGTLFIDRISPIKREFFKKRVKKAQKLGK